MTIPYLFILCTYPILYKWTDVKFEFTNNSEIKKETKQLCQQSEYSGKTHHGLKVQNIPNT